MSPGRYRGRPNPSEVAARARANYDDEQLKNELAAIVQALPPDSAARVAFAADKTAVEIMRLLPPEHPELLERLQAAYWAWQRRLPHDPR